MPAEKLTCREAKDLVKAYIDGTMSDRECTRFLDHVMSCPDCYDELETYFIVDYSLKYLDEDSSGRSYDMQKVLKDDIRWNERRIWRTETIRFITISGIIFSEILLVLTGIIKFYPELARIISSHISVLFPG